MLYTFCRRVLFIVKTLFCSVFSPFIRVLIVYIDDIDIFFFDILLYIIIYIYNIIYYLLILLDTEPLCSLWIKLFFMQCRMRIPTKIGIGYEKLSVLLLFKNKKYEPNTRQLTKTKMYVTFRTLTSWFYMNSDYWKYLLISLCHKLIIYPLCIPHLAVWEWKIVKAFHMQASWASYSKLWFCCLKQERWMVASRCYWIMSDACLLQI